MKQYWVVGGIYTDTRFKTIAGGRAEERFGPYPTYEEAEAEWARLAWQTVDDAHARYRIVEGPPAAADARRHYWVAGGVYTDTSFQRIADGGEEEWYGPYETYDDAETQWSRLAWQTVDDAHARYRIVKAEGPPERRGEARRERG